ncbi:MAG: class II SORL domain-containing protein [Candidatus Omnitrophica bacterium]|nr:class II SORL domain-containing protein [Candidatus Omnitrophota bacterium]
MTSIKDLYQSGDWKAEKHVPTIVAPDKAAKGEVFSIEVSVGKEIAHPNTSVHHIGWIEVYFFPEGEKFPIQISRCEFTSHGASAQGSDTSTIYSVPAANIFFKTEKSGTILASSYCNIHGLWEGSQAITIE